MEDIERRLNEMMKTYGLKPSDTERLRELCEKYKPTKMKRIKALLEKGADVNAEYGIYPKKTILRSVCDSYTPQKLELVKILIESGADIHATDNDYPKKNIIQSVCESYTPLKKELLETLLQNNQDEISCASCYKYSEVLTYADFLNMAIRVGYDINSQDENGKTLLHYKARGDDMEVIRILCSSMSNLDILDNEGCTPWPEWSRSNRDAVAQEKYVQKSWIFLSHGADPFAGKHIKSLCLASLQLVDTADIIREIYNTRYIDMVDEWGQSALHIAVSYDNTQIAMELLSMGADVNIQREDNGDTPLHIAAFYGRTEIVMKLLSMGADVNIQNNDGDTPLHEAAFRDKTKIVMELLNMGADIDIQNKDGATPLHKAVSGGNPSVVNELIQLGAKTNIQDNCGNIPFHTALMCDGDDATESIKYLMTMESWFHKDNDRRTSIDMVNPDIIHRLLTKALHVDSSLRIYQECIALLTYKGRKNVRQTLLALSRTPIPASLFPLVIAHALNDDEDRDDDNSSEYSYDSNSSY